MSNQTQSQRPLRNVKTETFESIDTGPHILPVVASLKTANTKQHPQKHT